MNAPSRAIYTCTVTLNPAGTGSPTMSCAPAGSRGAGPVAGGTSAKDLVLGNQGVNVELNFSGFAFSSQVFTMNVTVTNLLTQPIGTTDGSTTTATATRIYFTSGPFASGGTGGIVTLNNPDGTALFMGKTLPYFQYSPFIKAGATSASKTWSFTLANTTTGFAFQVEVDAAVPAQNSVLRWTQLRGGITHNQLNAVWQNTASDIWAVGVGGVILHNNGGAWGLQATGLPATTLNSVWGTSGTNVWAVGNGGVAFNYNGTSWSTGTTQTARVITGVWGSSPTTFYASANTHTGLTWNSVTSVWDTIAAFSTLGLSGNLHAVWGADANHVWMVGDKGEIVFYNGTTWSKVTSPTALALTAIWGTSSSNVYAVGALGTIVHYNGTSWTTLVSGTTLQLSGVGGTSATDIWAVGAGVTQHSSDGTTWTTIAPVAGMLISSIASASSYPLWAVGGTGALLSVSGTQFTLSNQSGVDLLGTWASSATDVWASTLGTILHYDGTNWTSANVSLNDSMKAIWGTGPTNVWTVGRSGTIAHFNGTSWSNSVVNPGACPCGYNGIYGTSGTNIVAVGEGGLVALYNGSTWSFPARTGTGDLSAVWAVGTTYFAVADDGTAYTSSNSGSTWTAMTFTPANANALFGVFGTSATDVWTTGDAGTAYTFTGGTGWVQPSPANGTATKFKATWLTSASDVYLVGNGGTVQHFNGSVWLPMSSPVPTTLYSIFGTAPQNVYIAGDVGVVVKGTGP